MDEPERRLARPKYELAFLLERNRSRTVDEVRHRAGGDRAERAHRARTDHIGVHLRGAACVRRLPVVRFVERHVPALRMLEQAARVSSRDSRAFPYSSVA